MSTNDTPVTHEQWEQARDHRNVLARQAALYLLNGQTELAMDRALKFQEADDEVLRLDLALEAQYAAAQEAKEQNA